MADEITNGTGTTGTTGTAGTEPAAGGTQPAEGGTPTQEQQTTFQKYVSVLITIADAYGYFRQPVVWCVATGGENYAKHFGRSLLRQHHTQRTGHGAQFRVEAGNRPGNPFRKPTHGTS